MRLDRVCQRLNEAPPQRDGDRSGLARFTRWCRTALDEGLSRRNGYDPPSLGTTCQRMPR